MCPCSNHSLNLFCLHAASMEMNSVAFFCKSEGCYTFFSLSTHRWEVLFAATGKTLKRIQNTLWSAIVEVVVMAWNHYKVILKILETVKQAYESLNTRTNAGTLLVAVQSLSFQCLWASRNLFCTRSVMPKIIYK